MDNKVLDLSSLDKTTITVVSDGQEKELSLNLSDMNLVARLQEKRDTIAQIEKSAKEIKTVGNNIEDTYELGKTLQDLDKELRQLIDYIFDAPVSETCMSFGSTFDIVNGKWRYEQVMDALMSLYSANVHTETEKLLKIQKHTSKYVNKA